MTDIGIARFACSAFSKHMNNQFQQTFTVLNSTSKTIYWNPTCERVFLLL